MSATSRSRELLPGSSRCYCTVCGHVFLTHVSFDMHRGIVASDDEEHQDQGYCWTVVEMEYHGLSQELGPWLWGTAAEIEQFRRFEAMRALRDQK